MEGKILIKNNQPDIEERIKREKLLKKNCGLQNKIISTKRPNCLSGKLFLKIFYGFKQWNK